MELERQMSVFQEIPQHRELNKKRARERKNNDNWKKKASQKPARPPPPISIEPSSSAPLQNWNYPSTAPDATASQPAYMPYPAYATCPYLPIPTAYPYGQSVIPPFPPDSKCNSLSSRTSSILRPKSVQDSSDSSDEELGKSSRKYKKVSLKDKQKTNRKKSVLVHSQSPSMANDKHYHSSKRKAPSQSAHPKRKDAKENKLVRKKMVQDSSDSSDEELGKSSRKYKKGSLKDKQKTNIKKYLLGHSQSPSMTDDKHCHSSQRKAPSRSAHHKHKDARENKSEYHKVGEAEYEKKTDYPALLALDDVDLVANMEKLVCPICLLDTDAGEGITLRDCLHSFCRGCLAGAIQFSETAVVKCPFQNDEYSCESHLQEREIKSLVTPDLYERHLQKSMALAESQAQDSFHCKTPDCPGWCLFEGSVYFKTFLCPVCKHANCLACAAIHEGKNCRQYQDDVAFRCDGSEKARKTKEYLQSEYHKVGEAEYEKKTDYQTLLALNDVNLVANMEKLECPICFLDTDAGEGVTLRDCLHSFCRECLAGAIQFSETAVVKCPFQNDEYSCESHLQEREIKCLVTPDQYERHLQKSMDLAESEARDSFHCKTPDCPGWCLFEDNVNTFLCPVCKHANCLTCAAIHEGKNCRQYQDDVAFRCDSNEEARKTKKYLQNRLENGKAMKCPQCQVIIMKKGGCDRLKCSMCHTELCWVTKGPRWGPKGCGDTSGGCKCMVNGVRCHPKCIYCC